MMVSPLGTGTMPLWDLIGRALGKPAYQLLAGAGPGRVPVYDGSIYYPRCGSNAQPLAPEANALSN